MKESRLEYRESGDALTLVFHFRRDRVALIFGGVWLFIWWGAIGLLGRKIATALAKPEPVPLKAWAFLIGFGLIGLFVIWHWLGLWKGRREVEFSPRGLTVRERRWQKAGENFYPCEKVSRLRPTFKGWTESLLFDFDGRPVGLTMPMTDDERVRLLLHPAVKPFTE